MNGEKEGDTVEEVARTRGLTQSLLKSLYSKLEGDERALIQTIVQQGTKMRLAAEEAQREAANASALFVVLLQMHGKQEEGSYSFRIPQNQLVNLKGELNTTEDGDHYVMRYTPVKKG